jgi:hypothetical protein
MRLKVAVAVIALLPLSGCGMFDSSPDEPPPTMGATYKMIDSNGAVVGKVVFTPLGQGQVFDAKGNLIGNIHNP